MSFCENNNDSFKQNSPFISIANLDYIAFK